MDGPEPRRRSTRLTATLRFAKGRRATARTGQDVKLFGDDTAVLTQKASEMASVLQGVAGASDLVVERVAGQPYLTVRVDREKLARYGVNASAFHLAASRTRAWRGR